MSRTKPDEIDRAGLLFECPRCLANPGQWCFVRHSARPAKYLHQARWQLVREVERLTGTFAALDAEWERSREIRNAITTLRKDIEAWRVKSDAEIVERLHQIWAM